MKREQKYKQIGLCSIRIGLCRNDFGLCIGIKKKKRTESTVLFVLQNFYHFNTSNVINQSKHLHF